MLCNTCHKNPPAWTHWLGSEPRQMNYCFECCLKNEKIYKAKPENYIAHTEEEAWTKITTRRLLNSYS